MQAHKRKPVGEIARSSAVASGETKAATVSLLAERTLHQRGGFTGADGRLGCGDQDAVLGLTRCFPLHFGDRKGKLAMRFLA